MYWLSSFIAWAFELLLDLLLIAATPDCFILLKLTLTIASLYLLSIKMHPYCSINSIYIFEIHFFIGLIQNYLGIIVLHCKDFCNFSETWCYWNITETYYRKNSGVEYKREFLTNIWWFSNDVTIICTFTQN